MTSDNPDIVETIHNLQQRMNSTFSSDVTDDNGTVLAASDTYTYSEIGSIFSSTEPAPLNMSTQVGTIWYNTSDADARYWWDGFDWVSYNGQGWHGGLGFEALGPRWATNAWTILRLYNNTTPGAPVENEFRWDATTEELFYYNGTTWVEIVDVNLVQAAKDALTVSDLGTDQSIAIFFQSGTPAAEGIGDLWFDPANDFRSHRWTGEDWVLYGKDARNGGETGESGMPPETVSFTVSGTATGLVVVMNGPIAADTELDYHISATPGFVPTEDTKVITTTSVINVITFLPPDGLELLPEVTYYLRVIARNPYGAANPSDEVAGTLNMSVPTEYIKGAIAAGFILTGQIQIGGDNFVLDADKGLVIKQSDGGIIDIPRDGTAATIWAHLVARSLLVENGATLRGESVLSGVIRIGFGVDDPDTVATVTYGYDEVKNFASALPAGFSLAGLVRNTANNGWVAVGNNSSDQSIWINIPDSGSVTSYYIKDYAAEPSALTYRVRGFTRIGSNYYLLGLSNFDLQLKLARFTGSLSGGAYRAAAEVHIADDFAESASVWPTLGNDGTSLKVAYHTTAGLATMTYSAPNMVKGSGFNLDLGDAVAHLGGYYEGNADFGALRRVVIHHSVAPRVYSAAETREASEEFSNFGFNLRGLWWDGTNFFVLTNTARIFKLEPNKLTDTLKVAYAWQTDDGSISTAISPVYEGTRPARSRATIVALPAPEAGSVSANAADTVTLYAGLGSGALTKQIALPVGDFDHVLYNIVAGAAAPTTNGFEGLSDPGTIISSGGDGDGSYVHLPGSGVSGRVGPHHWDENADGVGISVYKASAQTLSSGVTALVAMDTVRKATGGMELESGSVTVPYDGWYQVNGCVTFSASTASNRRIAWICSGPAPGTISTYHADSAIASAQDASSLSSLDVSACVYLEAGNMVGVAALVTGTAWGLDVSQTYMNHLSVVKVG